MIDRRRSVLLVEDSKTYTVLATAILEELGYDVRAAGSAEEGLTLAREEPPAIILMDINLPGMNGYDATCAIRQDSVLRYVPVIAMTVTEPVNQATIQLGMEAGFTGHTQKPMHEAGFRFLFQTYLSSGADGQA